MVLLEQSELTSDEFHSLGVNAERMATEALGAKDLLCCFVAD